MAETSVSRAFLEKWQVAPDAKSGEFDFHFPWRVQANGDKIVVFCTEEQADKWIASVRREMSKT